MIAGMDGLMTIGEFAARCGLSAKMLRAYADLGVVVPSSVDPVTGYRYYDAKQLQQAASLLSCAGPASPLPTSRSSSLTPPASSSKGGGSHSAPRSKQGTMRWRKFGSGSVSAPLEREE